jgi:PAS domain S-box-containing protein
VNINIDFLKAVLSATFWSSVFLSYILYRRREAAGAKYLSILMLISSVWTGGVLLDLLVKTIPQKEIGIAITFFGATFTPFFLLAFILDYFGYKKWLKWNVLIPLIFFPFLIMVLGFIPSTRHLIWQIDSINPENNISIFSYGKLFWIWMVIEYSILTASMIMLLKGLELFTSYYKRHTFVFIIATLFPICFNLIHVFRLGSFSQVDLTPVGFALSVAIIFFGIYNYQVFNLVPVAREKVIETISDAVLVTDKYSRIVMHNEAFRNYFRLGNSKLIGKHLENIFPHLGEFVSSDDLPKENEYHEFNFEDKTFELSIKPLLKAKTILAGRMVVLHDITHRKKIVEQLHLANLHLQEQLVFNDLLIEDLKAFSQTVAHNLKTPVNSIVGLSELLITSILEGKANTNWAEQVLNSGLKISKIIDELLLFSSISIKEIITEPIHMDSIIYESLKRNEFEISLKNISIYKPDKWPVVLGYAPWMEEVWVNLISNAIKYGGNPPVLTFGFEKEEKGTIIFYLQDNGDGLSKNQIELLFIPFTNLENSRADSHGLGLSIVNRIITKLNGKTWVISENLPGKGSRFCFTLPEKKLEIT